MGPGRTVDSDGKPVASPGAEDITMDDAQGEPVEVEEDAEMEEDEEQEEEEYVQKIRLLPGSTEHSASYEILEEGHTLGNALRFVIQKNPEVEFCAYAIPHPSENKMNLRIQTFESTTAVQALQKGLKDLEEACDVIAEKFTEARQDFMQARTV